MTGKPFNSDQVVRDTLIKTLIKTHKKYIYIIYIYIYTYTYTHIHTYTYKYTYTPFSFLIIKRTCFYTLLR